MSVLRFRVFYEEDDSIFRDIEIKPAQSFADLDSAIRVSYNLPQNMGSGIFNRSNDSWQKVKPLEIKPKEVGKGKAKSLMQPMLVSFIDDPHQRFVFEYNGPQEFVFLIELVSVTIPEKPETQYPACIKSSGSSPFKKDEPLGGMVSKPAAVSDSDDIDELEDDELGKEEITVGKDDDVTAMSEEGEEAQEEEEEEVEEEPEELSDDEFGDEPFTEEFTDTED